MIALIALVAAWLVALAKLLGLDADIDLLWLWIFLFTTSSLFAGAAPYVDRWRGRPA